jgi:geranylgeranylglycerol-phosphate geranylgeranyltransferase
MRGNSEVSLSIKKLLYGFFKLVRIEYSFFSALGVVLSGLLSGDLNGFQPEYLLAFSVVLFSAFGSFALNDYYDFDVDLRNRRVDRPIVSGIFDRDSALLVGAASISLVIFLSFFLNHLARNLVLLSLPIFILYNIRAKKVLLLKNGIIAGAYVATLFLGSLVSDKSLEPLIIYFALMGFIVGMAFEIMIDIIDVDGDRKQGIETLSTRFGVKRASLVSVFLYSLIIFLDPLPFFIMIDRSLHSDYLFLSLILIPVVSYFFVSKSLLREQTRETVQSLKIRVFITMQAGCIAYLVGVIV